ncbi:hypothetical protein AAFN60_02085 [Roseibacillus persicicus]|uniref:hypothetical protein n=1 Tax=Roseibacillus persicicus TaxID=454148 RepID=UPI00398AE53F
MADQNVKLNVKTTADTKALDAAAKALKEVDSAAADAAKALSAGDVEEAAIAYDRLADKVKVFSDEAKVAVGPTVDLDQELKDANATLDQTYVRMRKAAQAAREQGQGTEAAAVGTDKLKKSGRNTNLAILELSRGVEDLQYGIRGVLNNIPGLVLAMGGTAGLAGVISLVAVGMSVFGSALSSTKGETESLTEALDEATSASKDLSDQLLDRLQSARQGSIEGVVQDELFFVNELNDALAIQLRLLTAAEANATRKRQLEGQLQTIAIQRDPSLSEADKKAAIFALEIANAKEDQAAQIRIETERLRIAEKVQADARAREEELLEQRRTAQARLVEATEELARVQSDGTKALQGFGFLETLKEVADSRNGFQNLVQRGHISEDYSPREKRFRAQATTFTRGFKSPDDVNRQVADRSGRVAELEAELTALNEGLNELDSAARAAGLEAVETAQAIEALTTEQGLQTQLAIDTFVQQTEAQFTNTLTSAESSLSAFAAAQGGEISSSFATGLASLTNVLTDTVENAAQTSQVQTALQALGNSQEARDQTIIALINSLSADLQATKRQLAAAAQRSNRNDLQ